VKVALFLSFVAMGTVVSRKTDRQSAKVSPKPSEIDAQEFQRARPRRTDEKRTIAWVKLKKNTSSSWRFCSSYKARRWNSISRGILSA